MNSVGQTCSDAPGRQPEMSKLHSQAGRLLRYVAHAFEHAGSGGFPAARWWYSQDAPLFHPICGLGLTPQAFSH